MAKYIDAEKLKAELERQKYELKLSIQSQGDYGQSCHIVAYENILSLIDSLQEEQPPLPSNLDEAAEEYAYKTAGDHGVRFDSFKAGAEWMREQGETYTTHVEDASNDEERFPAIFVPVDSFKPGNKVVVQIRKKY